MDSALKHRTGTAPQAGTIDLFWHRLRGEAERRWHASRR